MADKGTICWKLQLLTVSKASLSRCLSIVILFVNISYFILQNELVISEPRRRTQIKRYGHDESVVDMSELETSSESDEDPSIGVGRGRGKYFCNNFYKFINFSLLVTFKTLFIIILRFLGVYRVTIGWFEKWEWKYFLLIWRAKYTNAGIWELMRITGWNVIVKFITYLGSSNISIDHLEILFIQKSNW